MSTDDPFDGELMEKATPKAGRLTISQDDAKALDDFVRHVGLKCYDAFGEAGSRSKSMQLFRQLERMRTLLDALIDYPKEELDFYWMPAVDMQTDEADPLLLAEVSERSGLHFHQVDIYLVPDDIFFGSLQIAVDDNAGETCGLVRISRWPNDMVAGPGWSPNGADLNKTIQIFVDAIPTDRVFSTEEAVEGDNKRAEV